MGHYRRVIDRDPESEYATLAAREAAKISYFDSKNFSDAIHFYEHLVKYSQEERERRNAQEQVAHIYFDKLNEYNRAIQEYNKLILLRNSNEEVANFHFYIARAQFYLGNFVEAQNEIEAALKTISDEEKKFEALMFLGNIYYNTKRTEQAVSVYENLAAKYPERAKAEKVDMNIVVCYEDMEAFDKAIEKLMKMRSEYSDQEFIDLKVKRLSERRANLPGSRGLRK